MWLPTKVNQNPVPALLEYIPYRKRDWTSARIEADVTALQSDVIVFSRNWTHKDALFQGLADLRLANYRHHNYEDDDTL